LVISKWFHCADHHDWLAWGAQWQFMVIYEYMSLLPSWIPKKTRNDGAAFMATTGQAEKWETEEQKNIRTGKVIHCFRKTTQIRHTPQ